MAASYCYLMPLILFHGRLRPLCLVKAESIRELDACIVRDDIRLPTWAEITLGGYRHLHTIQI
jgi:hypothetical protein